MAGDNEQEGDWSRGFERRDEPLEGGTTAGSSAATLAASAFFSSLGKAISEKGSALVNTIKQAAAQGGPQGGGGGSSLRDAAGGALSSLQQGLRSLASRQGAKFD